MQKDNPKKFTLIEPVKSGQIDTKCSDCPFFRACENVGTQRTKNGEIISTRRGTEACLELIENGLTQYSTPPTTPISLHNLPPNLLGNRIPRTLRKK